LRSSSMAFSLVSPKVGAVLRATENGGITLHFSGNYEPEDATSVGITLSIYTNRDKNPVFTGTFPLQSTGQTSTFDFLQQLRLAPGLFYYSFEDQGDGGMVWVGKFWVE
jgi:hypothetical protein